VEIGIMPESRSSAWTAAGATLLWGVLLGTVILGAGGRVAMRIVAEQTTGTSGFTLGGTATVVFLGLTSGAFGALILLAARLLLHRWPPATTVVYWTLLMAISLRGLRPVDPLRAVVFLPLVAAFGLLLQWRTWRYRRLTPAVAA
jgi:hypothetical protein